MISVIDYGVGNIGSILSMYRKLGIEAIPTNSPDAILRSKALILPGIGHFDAGMYALEKSGLKKPLIEAVLNIGIPLLGICLGMQMFADGSDEGHETGLGFIPGRVIKFNFPDEPQRKIPNIGWLELHNIKRCNLFPNPNLEHRYYFVHSFHINCDNTDHIIAEADYGGMFTAAVNNKRIWGTQFHPEKSHQYGMKLLKNFYDTTVNLF
jgi:glutamine amidotransferase